MIDDRPLLTGQSRVAGLQIFRTEASSLATSGRAGGLEVWPFADIAENGS